MRLEWVLRILSERDGSDRGQTITYSDSKAFEYRIAELSGTITPMRVIYSPRLKVEDSVRTGQS